MLNIININSLDEIKFECKNYQRFCIPLFHGTRRHMLSLSKEERQSFFSACYSVLEYLKTVLNDEPSLWNKLDNYEVEMLKTEYLHAGSYSIQQFFKRDKTYEYGNLYLVKRPETAMSYAKAPNGELGDLAYLAARFLKNLAIDIPNDLNICLETVCNYHSRYLNDERVVLVLPSADFDDLDTMSGVPLLQWYENEKEIQEDFDNYYSFVLRYKDFTDQSSFRIRNLEKYAFYLVKESMFDDLEKTIIKSFLNHYVSIAIAKLKNNLDLEVSWDGSFNIDNWGNYNLQFKRHDGSEFPVVLDGKFFSDDPIAFDKNMGADKAKAVDDRIVLRVAYTIFKASRHI